MSTIQTLRTYYANILRTPYAQIPASAGLDALAADVDAGRASLASAVASIGRLSIQTTAVGNLSYQFFTGASLKTSGLDYLINPAGPNPQNLNSAYYQSFNIENRFINFAVNLGKLGEGAQRFASAYGALSALDTVTRAYGEIFGATPTADKAASLLNDRVPDGRGGTFTRLEYFATYGLDGPGGIGTKAALVGWLLAQAAKEDIGPYAKAQDAFIVDLGPDGVAKFNVDLLAGYGQAAPAAPGAVITANSDQSVSPTATDPALRTTTGDDRVTGTGGLNAGRSVETGAGADTITYSGVVVGTINTGDGDDMVTIGGLGVFNTPVLGSPGPQYGQVDVGAGRNTVILTGGTAAGTRITASGSGNELHLRGPQDAQYLGAVDGFQTLYVETAGAYASQISGVTSIYVSVPSSAAGPGVTVGVPQAPGQAVVLKDTSVPLRVNGLDPGGVSVTLDHYTGAPTTTVTVGRGFYWADGGAVTVTAPQVNGFDSGLRLNVATDSTAGRIYGYTYSLPLGPNYVGPMPNLTIVGAGRLVAQVASSFTNVDASASAGVDIAYEVSAPSKVTLSSGGDTLRLQLPSLSTGSAAQSPAVQVVFGAGPDTVSLTGQAFANLSLDGQRISAPSRFDGFAKGVDHVDLGSLAGGAPLTLTGSAAGKAFIEAALIAVSADTPSGRTAVFEFGGDTWVYHQDTLAGANTGDGLIRLVGVTGLTTGAAGGPADIRFG